jgi:hypothetical protein
MAFHIDILPTTPKDGSPRDEWDCIENDYSIQECVDNGWLDPETGIWTRKVIEVPETDPDDDFVYVNGPWDDPNHGKDMGLNLVQVTLADGSQRWVHREGDGYLG